MTDILPKSLGAVVVTGASSGMGRACALRLSQAGYQYPDAYPCWPVFSQPGCLIGSKPVSSACRSKVEA
jgi:hypothetical protein